MAVLRSEISPSNVRRQLNRIVGSRTFSRFDRHKRFLTLLVEQALAGVNSVSEATIATLVFNREQPFDSDHDPIVRVYKRQLQRRLEDYYAREGVADSIVISVSSARLIARVASRRPHGARTALKSRCG
jgi:hypothetical protein